MDQFNQGPEWYFPSSPHFKDWGYIKGLPDIVGWLITTVMISFGASFWFDLLSKLVNRRVTGPKPDDRTS